MHSSIDAQVEKKNKEKQSLSISKVCYCVYNSKICALPTAKERGGKKMVSEILHNAMSTAGLTRVWRWKTKNLQKYTQLCACNS